MDDFKRNSLTSPKYIRARFRPWLWPIRLLGRLTYPVNPSLWLINVIFQRILGLNSSIPWMVHFTSFVIGKVTIGKNVWKSFAISGHCYIQGFNGVYIDDDTIFAPGVKMISANHDKNDLGKNLHANPIKIGKRCWIGANAVILPGVELEDDVVVGAGAVVTKSFPKGSIIAGVPARVLHVK